MSENNGFDNMIGPVFMPDGNGSFVPCPFVLTEQEAIRFLRLDVNGPKKPELTLRHYRHKNKLEGTQIGNRLRYTLKDLLKFLEKNT